MKKKRTLYECSHARVDGRGIYCHRQHPLSDKSGNGHIDVRRLARGEPLSISVCQICPDFDRLGAPLLPEDRGWTKDKAR